MTIQIGYKERTYLLLLFFVIYTSSTSIAFLLLGTDHKWTGICQVAVK